MKRAVGLVVFLGALATLSGFYLWLLPDKIRHHTEDDLAGLTCAELSLKHQEIVDAYHDASIADFRKTGTFDDDLGLPDEDVLPFVIVMKKVTRENDLAGFDLTLPFFHSASAATPRLHVDFYYELSGVCATHPALDAVTATLQAAQNLGVKPVPKNSR